MSDDTPLPPAAEAPTAAAGERIAKRLARAGLCSRRDAERWIALGRVAVNGTVLTSPAVTVRPSDRVVVDGKPLPTEEPTRLWRFHKPAGLVTTARDEKGRPTVFDRLPPELPRVISVGRLDLTTEGLLLLTNDGELARFMELPATGWLRRYRVRVHGRVDEVKLAELRRGVTIARIAYGPIEATLDRQQASNAWLTVSLREGKNREIRHVLENLGLTVNRLIRMAYGPFQLGKLGEGEVEEVPRRVIRDQLPHHVADDPASAPVPQASGTAERRRPAPKRRAEGEEQAAIRPHRPAARKAKHDPRPAQRRAGEAKATRPAGAGARTRGDERPERTRAAGPARRGQAPAKPSAPGTEPRPPGRPGGGRGPRGAGRPRADRRR